MKTATIRQIRNHFPAVLRLIQNGETVAITSRRKVVANLTPPSRPAPTRRAWSDIDKRLRQLESQPLLKMSGAEILAEDRERM